jgi:hypothetical protein
MSAFQEPPLKTAEVDPQTHRHVRRSIDPSLDVFTNRTFAARFWFVISVVLFIVVIAQPYYITMANRIAQKVAIVDPAGDIHITPLVDFENAAGLHEEMATWACHALFMRGPKGPDMPKLLDALYIEPARSKASKLIGDESKRFQDFEIHQKCEVSEYIPIQVKADTVVATVKGQLVRTVLVSGQVQSYGVPFVANLVMAQNPDYSKKGRFPLGIYEIEIQYPQGNIFPQ